MKLSPKRLTLLAIVIGALMCASMWPATNAQRRSSATAAAQTVPGQRAKDAARHSGAAAKVFSEVMRVPDKAIPKELLEKAEAVAVFPNVLSAAFVVGGRKGQGLLSRRTPSGWSAPVFYNLSGGSVGAQIGASSTDFVLLFMNEEGLKGLMEDKFEIGGEASIAAGPVGRAVSASTNVTFDAGILSYSRNKGAFIGAAIKGVAITPDNDLNEAFYGQKANEIVLQGVSMSRIPSSVRAFPLTLSRYSKR